MTDLLELVRLKIERDYAETLGLQLSAGLGTNPILDMPVWAWLAQDTLREQKGEQREGDIGGLFDADIGTVHLFVDYTGPDTIRPTIIRALNVRSAMRPERGEESDDPKMTDSLGSWRIVLIWLAREADRDKWISDIAEIREKSGFSEELTFDVIFYDTVDPKEAIDAKRFARLHLALRKVLGFSKNSDALKWMSADEAVKDRLDGFSRQFKEPGERELAREVETIARKGPSSENATPLLPARFSRREPFQSFEVENFRCIRTARLDLGSAATKSAVVFGPNGTGKSSLTEAISLARFGTSSKCLKFYDEEPAEVSDRSSAAYFKNYIHHYRPEIGAPAFRLGNSSGQFELLTGDEARRANLALEANVLTQEQSLAFVHLPASELQSRVLRSYSDLAQFIESEVGKLAGSAHERRKEYLRSVEATASVKRVDTIKAKLAASQLRRNAPEIPTKLKSWLRSLALLNVEGCGRLVELIDEWEGKTTTTDLGESIAKADSRRRELKPYVVDWLADYRDLMSRGMDQVSQARKRLGENEERVTELLGLMEVWGRWLEGRDQTGDKPAIEAAPTGQSEVTARLDDLARLRSERNLAQERLNFLEQARKFIDTTWQGARPHDCPTCGALYGDEGGIKRQVESLTEKTKQELERLTKQVDTIAGEVKQAQIESLASVSAASPISEDEQSNIVSGFQWLSPQTHRFEEVLGDAGKRSALAASVEAVRVTPEVVVSDRDLDEQAESLISDIEDEWQRAERVFEESTNWDTVREILDREIQSIVKEKLPETIESLWQEIAQSLTAASWVNYLSPEMKVSARGQQRQLKIEIDERLTRYFFNCSENQLLGLAWFFANYLIRGRFESPLMVMDDPAQEMDETTFREFSRFCETFLRLHKRLRRPLTLILLHHQESRAIEIAQATGSKLYTLKWSSEQRVEANEVSVLDESLRPRHPLGVFQ
jgi:hypothetical protein